MDRGIKEVFLDEFDVYGHRTSKSYDVGYKWDGDKPEIYGIWTHEDILDALTSWGEANYLMRAIENEIIKMEKGEQEELEKEDQGAIYDLAYDRWRDER